MSQPQVAPLRAAGVRTPWTAVPPHLRAWAEHELGSPVIVGRTQVGGFSPGVAARLTCADGTRAFVKAVAESTNPHSCDLLRTEGVVLASLPASRLRPEIRGTYDAHGWVGLLLEDIDGHLPDLPWSGDDLARVLAALAQLGEELTPCPWPDAPAAVSELRSFFSGWRALAAAPPDDLPRWVYGSFERLIELEEALVAAIDAGSTLCHIDVRSDNILLAGERVVFVDWNWAAVGPRWLDTAFLGWEVITANGDLPPELLHAEALRGIDPYLLTATVAAGAGTLQAASRDPAPPGLPTIRPWQRRYADELTAWLERRSGWR